MTLNRRMIFYLLTSVIAFLIAACSPGKPLPGTGDGQATTSPNPLANTQWRLVSFEEGGTVTPVIEGTDVTLEFDEAGQAGGSGGCNTFGGGYSVQDGEITISDIVTTEIACTAAGVMDQEGRYYQALQFSSAYEFSGDQLVIHYNEGQGALNFTSRAAGTTATPPQSANPLAKTHWTLETFGEPDAHTPVIAGTTVTLEFDAQGQAGGSGGCNSFGAPYSLEGDTISFDQITSTLMACTQAGVGEQETNYLEALRTASRFEVGGDRLTIWYGDGTSTLDFVASGSRPTETPSVEPVQPTPTSERIEFETGATSAKVNGELEASGSDLYVIEALKGQTLTVELSFTQGRAILAVWGADGTVLLSDHAEASRFQSVLPSTQDYYILVDGRPEGGTDYSMQVTIPPLETNQPTPAPERIRFDTGATSATVSGHLQASGSDEYVLEAQAGQTMSVELSFTQGRAILAIWGADGTVLMSDHAEASIFNRELPSSQDYYILVEGRPDGETDYRMTVAIPD